MLKFGADEPPGAWSCSSFRKVVAHWSLLGEVIVEEVVTVLSELGLKGRVLSVL